MNRIKCVHTEHCCRNHGCKYGDRDCPVWLGYKVQSYPQECCYDIYDTENEIPHVEDLLKPSFKEYAKRRADCF